MAQVFSGSFLLVAPFWGLMVLLPNWHWTKRLIGSPWIAAPAALLYTVLVIPNFFGVLAEVANPTLAGISALLGTPAGATIAWVHFLAFDLFVGRWIYLDSRERGLSPWFVSPILILTLLLAPMGFLLYLAGRTVLARSVKSSGQPHERPG